VSSSLTRTEVCHLLGVSPKSLYLWERDGHIPAPHRDRRNWRVYSPKDVDGIRRFLGMERGEGKAPRIKAERAEGLSARNQLKGTVVSLRKSGLICEVVMRLAGGQEITSIITEASADRLGLKKGREATAVIKATEVMILG
jgi:molybdopterin-binding protein